MQIDQQKLCIKTCDECMHLVLPEVNDRMRGTGYMRCPHTKVWVYLSPCRAPLLNGSPCPYAEPKLPNEAAVTSQPVAYELF